MKHSSYELGEVNFSFSKKFPLMKKIQTLRELQVYETQKNKKNNLKVYSGERRENYRPKLATKSLFSVGVSNIFGFLGFYIPFIYLPSLVESREGISG